MCASAQKNWIKYNCYCDCESESEKSIAKKFELYKIDLFLSIAYLCNGKN